MENRELKIAIVDDQMDLLGAYSRIIEKRGYSSPAVFTNGRSLVRNITGDNVSNDVIMIRN